MELRKRQRQLRSKVVPRITLVLMLMHKDFFSSFSAGGEKKGESGTAEDTLAYQITEYHFSEKETDSYERTFENL